MNACGESRSMVPYIFNLCCRWMWVVSFTPDLFIPREEFRFPLNRMLGGREKSLEPAKIRTPERSIHILVTIPTTDLFNEDTSRCEPGSSVGIATGHGLDGPGSNPGGGDIFRTRPDRLWGPPGTCTMGTGSLSRGKAARAWCWPPTPPSAEVKYRVPLVPVLF
jgi:hypothetical protein